MSDLKEAQPEWFRQAFKVPRRQGTVVVDGIDIAYLQWGDPNLPGVVLTHGMMAHARCWAFIAPLLAQDYCLTAFDLSGMGDSGWRSSPYTIEARVAECLAVAAQSGMSQSQRPALVCHSYGGSVGLTAVETQPDAWSSLIVCDMTMLAPSESPRFEEFRRRRAAREVQPHRVSPDFAAIQERYKLAPPQPCANDYLMEYMARHSVKQVPDGFVWKFDPHILAAVEDRDDTWWQSIAARFSALTLPRAVVYGEWSEMMSETARQYVTAQTNGQVPLVQIDQAYHHIMLDQPLAVVDALSGLLAQLGPA